MGKLKKRCFGILIKDNQERDLSHELPANIICGFAQIKM